MALENVVMPCSKRLRHILFFFSRHIFMSSVLPLRHARALPGDDLSVREVFTNIGCTIGNISGEVHDERGDVAAGVRPEV